MKYKPILKVLMILVVLGLVFTQTGLASRLLDMMADPGGNVTLSESDFSVVGGFSSVDEASLESSSRPPSHLTLEDYQPIHREAQALLKQGLYFRKEKISIVPADTLEHALQNYADFNDGALFHGFCQDYDAIDERGYCPIRIKLILC